MTYRAAMRPLEIGVHLLAAAFALGEGRTVWRREAYEFVADVPAIDLLTGSAGAREVVEGRAGIADLMADWDCSRADFAASRRDFLLYPEETDDRPDLHR